MKYIFPENFLWGASTSSHQVEGGLENDWTEWEKRTAFKNSKSGLRSSNQSLSQMVSEEETYISNSKYSPESFKNLDKDIVVIKELKLKAYRLSVEWSRIQPEKSVFSKEGIQYYIDLLRELKKNNIKVVLTCWHWTLPLWLEQEGGLLSKEIRKYFLDYVRFLYENLHEYVDYWITINEPESFIFSYLVGTWPPGKKNIFLFNKVFSKILPTMHIDTYELIKGFDSKIPVSVSKSFWYITPYNNFFWNRWIAKLCNMYINTSFLDKVVNYVDFLGLNFYFHNKVGIMGLKNENDRVSDLGWWLDPSKLYDVIKYIDTRYNVPILITENGVADSDDVHREWWISESVKAMHRAISSGSNILGYLYWSLLDNFEWDKGYWPQFGLCKIDPDTKERIIRGSGRFYSKIIEKNGIVEDI